MIGQTRLRGPRSLIVQSHFQALDHVFGARTIEESRLPIL
jgi:hypothetical protein